VGIVKKLKQLVCEHYFLVSMQDEYASVGDKYHKIKSAKTTFYCERCGYTITVLDRQMNYIENIIKRVGKIER
jgi:hypothetical protein